MNNLRVMLSQILFAFIATAKFGLSQHHQPHDGLQQDPPMQIFQFGSLVEIESQVVRANGDLLVTTPSPTAEIWRIDPTAFNGSAQRVVSLNDYSALGILEIDENVFAVTHGKVVAGPKGVTGSFSLTLLKMTGDGASSATSATSATIISQVAVPEAGFLNKLAPLQPCSDIVLASDSNRGLVYAINTTSSQVQVVLQDAKTMSANTSIFPVGINGMQRVGPYLYYVNSSKGLLCRVLIQPDGRAAGPYEIVANFSRALPIPDNFVMLSNGDAFIAGSNQIAHVRSDGSFTIVAGGVNDKTLAGATSAMFGRGAAANTLYITTSGHISSPANITFVEPGKVIEIQISE